MNHTESDILMVVVSSIWHQFRGESAISGNREFYGKSCDTLIWDICIMGGEPAYIEQSDDTSNRIERYVALFNTLIARNIGWKRYTLCTIVEVRGTILVLADLSNYPDNFFT